jgi:hypothetical protein
MVEIRVSVEDGSNAAGLIRRLAGLFGRSSISFDRARKVVRVESEWAPLSLGEHSHTLARSVPLAVSR